MSVDQAGIDAGDIDRLDYGWDEPKVSVDQAGIDAGDSSEVQTGKR